MTTDANAPGARSTLGLIRGLDGIRAMSVLAIIAFHTGLSAVPGGFYGVDSFFVLSGFLITSILVKEWGSTGTIGLRHFWAARARRLLPALFLLITAIGIVSAFVPRVLAAPHALGNAIATVFYASNWYSIHNGASYFTLSQQQPPLLHTWSLAIEEQFYLVWPLVVLGVLTLRLKPKAGAGAGAPRHLATFWTRRRRLYLLFGSACVGALVSAGDMARLAPDGYTTRAYYGTDTRAQALLVGAAIAIGLTLWREASQRRRFVRVSAGLGLAGMAGTAAMWATTTESSAFAFRGGFLLVSLAAGGVVLCAAVAPKSLVVRFLELPPLPQLGRISYGIYLWYWPVLIVMSDARLHWGVYELFLARVAVTASIAAVSYQFVEMPIRRGLLQRRRSWAAAPLGVGVALTAAFAGTLVPVGAAELQGSAMTVSQLVKTPHQPPPSAALPMLTPSVPPSPAPPTTFATASGGGAGGVGTGTGGASGSATGATKAKPVKVLLLGDSMAGSLGVGLAQYASVKHVQIANEGIPGCSLSMQTQIKVLFYSVAPTSPCDVGDNPDSLLTVWQRWVDAYNPDVVVYLARGETFDQQVGGQWESPGQPSFDSYLKSRYQDAINVLGSRGAAVVFMTTPYSDSGTTPSGAPWPENDPARAQVGAVTMRSVAAATDAASSTTSADSAAANAGGPATKAGGPAANAASTAGDTGKTGEMGKGGAAAAVADSGRVYVFDLNTLVSPGNQFAPSVDGVNVRCGDGVHFTPSGGLFVGLRLVPELALLGQAHAVASPGGAWPGPLPPSTPPWFHQLPCQ